MTKEITMDIIKEYKELSDKRDIIQYILEERLKYIFKKLASGSFTELKSIWQDNFVIEYWLYDQSESMNIPVKLINATDEQIKEYKTELENIQKEKENSEIKKYKQSLEDEEKKTYLKLKEKFER